MPVTSVNELIRSPKEGAFAAALGAVLCADAAFAVAFGAILGAAAAFTAAGIDTAPTLRRTNTINPNIIRMKKFLPLV